MTKHRIHMLLLALCLAPGAAKAQTGLQDPRRTDSLREQGGSRIRSYDSRFLALKEDDAHSLYMQNLSGQWKVKTYASPVQLDSLVALPSVDDSDWAVTTVPEKAGNGAWAAVYRTEFKMPFKWIDREIFVRLDAVSRACYVYVNGHLAGYHTDSRTPAYFDVTKYVVDAKNTLTVIAYANPASAVLENQSDTKGTMIGGGVTVFAQPKVRLRDFVVDTRFDPQGNGLFSFGAIVKSHLLNPKEVTVHYELIAPDSTVVAKGKRDARFHLKAEDTVRFFENIPGIESWSHESPKLYTVALRLQHEGRFTEYTKVKIGFRDLSFDDKGIRVNGRPVELRAVDYDPPADEETLRRDLTALRKNGVNLVRVSRYPQSDRFYELTDGYGIYVCDRANLDSHLSGDALTPDGTPANDPLWETAHADRVMNMYYASQNHPSVIMFSLGRDAGRGYNMYEAYLRLKEVEKNRPVVYEKAGAEWNGDIVIGKPEGRNASDTRYSLSFAKADAYNGAAAAGNGTTIAPGSTPGQVMIRNGFSIANLKNFRVGYSILSGKRVVKEGACTADIPPQETAAVDIPLDGVKPGKYRMEVWVAHQDSAPAAQDGERIAGASIALEVPKTAK